MKLLTLAALSVALGFSQSTDCDTLDKCQEVLKTNRRSSFVHFRIGEFYFQQGNLDKPGSPNCTSATGRANPEVNREKRPSWIYLPNTILGCNSKHYQNAANEFREVLIGDLEPKWTEVWAHVNLGKIYDVTSQRERALNEYRRAIRTLDNTRGALDEAIKYTEAPYKPN
jgi:tetratricopeptide (TPR) repeat protein